jgi:serine protease AprX
MIMSVRLAGGRGKVVWGLKRTFVAAATALGLFGLPANSFAAPDQAGAPGAPGSFVKNYKLDDDVSERAEHGNPQAISKVIVTLVPGAELPPQFNQYSRGGKLDIINGQVLELPNGVLRQLGANADVFRVHHDRPIFGDNYRTAVTVGARAVQESLGYTGAGIGVAVIDSGVTTWHDDLTSTSSHSYPYGNQRVTKFVDFVNGAALPYDDNGHGSHVAGTILGNGYDSLGEKAGIAPGASLVALKVLDADGQGTISNMIRALSWVAANYKTYNVRVVNVSVGAGIYESYWTDPLTLAAKAVADKGITVVAAAGNLGQNAEGKLQLGGITAPGNAPWVLTVGASSTLGTLTRADDEMAGYSSSGPTFIDFSAKPDLVAPGTGTVSLATAGSALYASQASYLLDGSVGLGYKPYLSLSGTSMAAPVVAGTVALMLEANPKLTPNLIKAILQYTAESYPGYSPLRQGAGFLNSLGAVRLASFYASDHVGDTMPVQRIWSRQVIWGNHRLVGGYLNPRANAWAPNTLWGAAKTGIAIGENIVWGTRCPDGACDNIVWGTRDANGDNIVWGTGDRADNIVWGTVDRGDNIVWGTVDRSSNIVWGTGGRGDNIVWGTVDRSGNIVWGTGSRGDNIVWGTWGGSDNIVWGTSCGGADCTGVVWGSARGDNIVWGTADRGDNIVWGTVDRSGNIVWGTADRGDNIVWGTASRGDNIVWGTAGLFNIVWGTGGAYNIVWGTWRGDNIVWGTAADAVPAVSFPDIVQSLPNLQLEFGDIVPLPRGGR